MATRRDPIGQLTEPLALQSNDPPSSVVSSLTQMDGRAEATTATPHGLNMGDYVEIAGAVPAGYNGGQIQVIVVDATHFSYGVDAALASPATGTITVDFRSDLQGGQGSGWWTIGQLWGLVQALTATERLAAEAVASTVAYRVTIHYQPDIRPAMRLGWLKYQRTTPVLLQIEGVFPPIDPVLAHRYLILECSEIQ